MADSEDICERFWNLPSKPGEEARRERLFLDDVIQKAPLEREIASRLDGVRTILDAGAGTGCFSIPLARQGFRVTHLDISQRMIDTARQLAQDADVLNRMRFERGRVGDLKQYEDGGFDLVICCDAPISYTVFVATKKAIPANNLKAFISYAKANQAKLNMGHAGVGSITHFSGLLFNSLIGIKPAMVPFTGTAPATNALIAGDVDYMTGLAPDVIPQAQAGTIKVFAVSSTERNPALSNVPTSEEAGMPEFQVSAWIALFAPKNTPSPILDRLSDALDKALDDGAVRKRIIEIGCEVPGKARRGRQALTSLLPKEIARWVPVIKAANTQ